MRNMLSILVVLLVSSTAYAKPFVYCPDKCGVMDSLGFWIHEPKYDSIVSYDLPSKLWRFEKNKKYGYIDLKGNVIIPEQFEDTFGFSPSGLAPVRQNGKWGYCNVEGEIVVPFQFDYAHRFSPNGLASVNKNGKWGHIDTTGKMIIPAQLEYDTTFSPNGLAAVNQNGKWGFINTKGIVVIPARYDAVGDFSSNGLAVVEQNGKWGFIDAKGKEVIPFKFDGARTFTKNDRSAVKINEKYGYVDAKGKLVIPNKFDYASDFTSNNRARVELNGKYGYIDTKGEIVVPIEFDSAYESFLSNAISVVTKNGKDIIIDSNGRSKIPFEYDSFRNLSDDVWQIEYKGKGRQIFDITTGKQVATHKCYDNNCFVVNTDDKIIWSNNPNHFDNNAILAKFKAEAKELAEKAQSEKLRKLNEEILLKTFRAKLDIGSDTHCGMVIEVKQAIVKVQTIVGEKWFKVGQLFPKGTHACRFYNNEYVEN